MEWMRRPSGQQHSSWAAGVSAGVGKGSKTTGVSKMSPMSLLLMWLTLDDLQELLQSVSFAPRVLAMAVVCDVPDDSVEYCDLVSDVN